MQDRQSGRRARWVFVAIAAAAMSVAPVVAQAEEPVTLKVMFWHDAPGWMNEVDLFQEANPDVKIEYEAVPFGDYYAKAMSYIAAGDGPDVMGISPGWTNDFQGALQPVYEDLKDLFPNLNGTTSLCPDLDCSTNQYLGVPFSMQGFGLYYNKRVLEDAGVAAPPTTWTELADTCEKVKAIGKTCFAVGAKDFGDDILFGAVSLNTIPREEYMGYMTGTSKYTDPPFVNALAIYQDMAKRGWLAPTLLEDPVDPNAQSQFINGEAAFFEGLIGDAYHWYAFDQQMDPADFGATRFPSIETDNPLPGVSPGPLAGTVPADSGGAFTIPTWSKQRDAALRWLAWWASPEAQARLAQAGVYPTLKTVDSSAVESPQFAQLVPLVNEAQVAGIGGWVPQKAMDEVGVQLHLLVQDQTTPEQAAQRIQEASER